MATQRITLTLAQSAELHRRLKAFCATEASKYYEAGGPVGVRIGDFCLTLSAMPLVEMIGILATAIPAEVHRTAEQVVEEVDE